jgi:FkbM family methyltransferase
MEKEMRDYLNLIKRLDVEIAGIKGWYQPTEDNQTFSIILKDWVEAIRPELQSRFPERKGTVIQAGGNFGLYPVLYTEFFETVYTFEPDPINFTCLVMNCQHHSIIKMNNAVGEDNGHAKIVVHSPSNLGMNAIAKTESYVNSIPIVKVDSFDFQEVKLIQFDLEGYELPALKGTVNTIKKYKPLIMLESSEEIIPEHYRSLVDFLKQLGYNQVKRVTQLDYVFEYQGN